MDNWIPVSERLPNHGETVFFARLGTVHRGEFHDYGQSVANFTSDGMRYWHPAEKVTHWMPSPTPKPPVL